MTPRIPLLITASFLAFFGVGCGTLKVAPEYSAQNVGPLSELPPTRLAVQVRDERPPEERDEIGRQYNTFGGVARTLESIRPVPEIIREAIKSELQLNGHQIVDASDDPRVHVDLALKRFYYECKPKLWDIEVIVAIVADFRLTCAGETQPPATITTSHRKSRQIVGSGSHVKIINEGLAEFLRAVSFDPRIVEGLQCPPASTDGPTSAGQ